MKLLDERPTLDPGICFICELSPDGEYVDTLFNFEPSFFTPLIGRKFVCRSCVEQMAKLIGFGDKEKISQELDMAHARVRALETQAFEAAALLGA